MKKEPEVTLQAPFLDYNSWLNIYDVYQFYYNTEYGFITLLTYKSKMSKEMDIKVRSLGLGDFNLKEQNGFLILTIDGVLVNLKNGFIETLPNQLIDDYSLTSEFYYYRDYDNERITIFSAIDSKILRTIDTRLKSFSIDYTGKSFTETDRQTNKTTKYQFENFQMKEVVNQNDYTTPSYDIQIDDLGYILYDDEIIIFNNDVYYAYVYQMDNDKSSYQSDFFILNNGNILLCGISQVEGDDYDVVLNGRKVKIYYELYDVLTKKRKDISLNIHIDSIINNKLLDSQILDSQSVLTDKVHNLVLGRRINPKTKAFIDAETILLTSDNELKNISFIKNALGPVTSSNLDQRLISSNFMINEKGMFVFDEQGEIQHFYQGINNNHIIYDKFIISKDTTGNYSIKNLHTNTIITTKLSKASSSSKVSNLFINKDNQLELLQKDGSLIELEGTYSHLINPFDKEELNVYVTFNWFTQKYSYYDYYGNLLFSNNYSDNQESVVLSYQEGNTYRFVIQTDDYYYGRKYYVIEGDFVDRID